MNVPFVDLKLQHAAIRTDVAGAIDDVIDQTSFIMGPQLARFEASFAAYCTSRYAIGVGSGTAALELALRALDIGEGDEVVVPAHTYVASAMAISAVGARPVFVDADEAYLIDAGSIEAAITPKTRAIMPVHLYGQAVPMRPVLDIARRYGLRVVEDACQAHGARWEGRPVGSIGDIGCFSFYPGKNLGAYGDGGAIVTGERELDERIRLLRDFGQKKKYEHIIKGGNSRLDTIQAAILEVKLRRLDEWNEKRRESAGLYDVLLQEAGFPTPHRREREGHVYHLYVTRVENRAHVQADLVQRGVQTGIHYPVPVHLQPAYEDLGARKGSFPRSEAFADTVLSLPMYPGLSEEQIRYVVDALAQVATPTAAVTHA